MTLQPIRSAERHCFGEPDAYVIALGMQSGTDLHE